MFKVTKSFKSNKEAFFAKLNSDIEVALRGMGIAGLSNIKSLTPVAIKFGGFLKASNKYEIEGNKLSFINTAYYAPYVEFGTRFMLPQSFMRRGINNSISPFNQILIKTLKV